MKILTHSDDAAAFMAAVVGLAGIFDVSAKLGISADELAMALGFGFTIVAFIRGRFEKSKRSKQTAPTLVDVLEPVPPDEAA